MTDGRILGPAASPEERAVEEMELDRSLRPRSLDDFVGQASTKEHLSIILDAAKARDEPADHLLFAGSPGLGCRIARYSKVAGRNHRHQEWGSGLHGGIRQHSHSTSPGSHVQGTAAGTKRNAL